MLIDWLLGEVHSFDTDVKVLIYVITDAGIKLSSVQCIDREAEGTAAAGVCTGSEVLCTETFTPGVTHSCRQIVLLVVHGEVVGIFREVKQTSVDADIAKDLKSTTRRAIHY